MGGLGRVCVFAGSSPGASPDYAEAARRLGRAVVAAGASLVYGGARVGLMGEVADAVLGAGGEVVGVIPEALVAYEVAHEGLTELRVVASMHERKAIMAGLADAFVALPGGFGTLEETFETLTWTQLGLHAKPTGLLDVVGFYTSLVAFLDNAVAERFVTPEHRDLVLVDDDADRLLARLAASRPARSAKWIDAGDT